MDISALNHNDIILSNGISNGINTLNSRITDNYNLLYSNFSPAEKITYALAGTEFINTIANMIEAYMIINLRSRVLTIENNNYLKSSNIVSSNINAVINGTDNLETINNTQSKIIASNHNGVLIHSDYLVTEIFCNNNYLTFNMLKDTEDKTSLLNGTNWRMTEAGLIL